MGSYQRNILQSILNQILQLSLYLECTYTQPTLYKRINLNSNPNDLKCIETVRI